MFKLVPLHYSLDTILDNSPNSNSLTLKPQSATNLWFDDDHNKLFDTFVYYVYLSKSNIHPINRLQSHKNLQSDI